MKKAKAKLIVTVTSNRGTDRIQTAAVHDTRTDRDWTPEQIKARGITDFLNLADLRESLNWNLNGDARKYRFSWGPTGRTGSTGAAYVFD